MVFRSQLQLSSDKGSVNTDKAVTERCYGKVESAEL